MSVTNPLKAAYTSVSCLSATPVADLEESYFACAACGLRAFCVRFACACVRLRATFLDF